MNRNECGSKWDLTQQRDRTDSDFLLFDDVLNSMLLDLFSENNRGYFHKVLSLYKR